VLRWRLLLLVGAKAQMGENTEDVMEHGCVHPPALLGEVGVVREFLADLILLLAQGVNLGREVHDSPHDRVLITVSHQARWTHLWTIRILHPWGSRVPDLHRTQCCLRQCSLHPKCNARSSPQSSSGKYLPGVMVLPTPTEY
jgi:hypothetical protein